MTTISLKIPETIERRLSQIAEKRGTSKSELIREAVERTLASSPAGKLSCLAAASSSVGCVAGPSDLSYNKKHLKGFGK